MEGSVAFNDNQRDYFVDDLDLKHGKHMHCTEDRLDSGLDSMKEGEYQDILKDMEELKLAESQRECIQEPWKEQMTEDRDTLLHLAIIHEAKECIQQIIERSRNDPYLNFQNNQRQTPLHLAVITEQPLVVAALLQAGCDPRMPDQSGNTALHIACRQGSMSCFSVLVQYCSREHLTYILSCANYDGHSCLHLVSLHGYLHLVECLIQLGADVNVQEQCSGRTALHLAVDLQNPSLVNLLIEKGANVNSLTYGGFTPYHLTYGRQSAEIQQQLYKLTAPELRELPESDEEDETEEGSYSEDDDMYDDIQLVGC